MNRTQSGRVMVRGGWRPAHYSEDGHLFLSPDIAASWRVATPAESATWQARRPEHQGTVGRIWDDSLYLTD